MSKNHETTPITWTATPGSDTMNASLYDRTGYVRPLAGGGFLWALLSNETPLFAASGVEESHLDAKTALEAQLRACAKPKPAKLAVGVQVTALVFYCGNCGRIGAYAPEPGDKSAAVMCTDCWTRNIVKIPHPITRTRKIEVVLETGEE